MELMLEETEDPDLFVPGSLPRRMAGDQFLADYHDSPPVSRNRPPEPVVHAGMAGPPPDQSREPENHAERLARLLRDLVRTASRAKQRGPTETWTHTPISRGLNLSARDLDDDSRSALESAADALRALIREDDDWPANCKFRRSGVVESQPR